MTILLNAHKISKAFAGKNLFENLSFGIEERDRIGLIGVNGSGKSTLLKIIAGLEEPDAGTLSKQASLKVGYLSQNPALNETLSILQNLLSAVDVSIVPDPSHDWESIAKAEELISLFEFERAKANGETLVQELSGGWKKRVALAKELMRNPQLLLLDEPTNHLDIESIEWLESFLKKSNFATLTITHDRHFLNEVATRIWELDLRNPNGGLLCLEGSYADYIEVRNELIENQKRQEWSLKNTLRRETEWLRRGAKARTTKQSARIERHGELKSEVERLSEINKNREVNFAFQAERGPKKLVEAKNISKSFNDKVIFANLSLVLGSKSRLGLVGRNGAGKSTLIKVLLGIVAPDQGQVSAAENLQVAYFEQSRDTLNPNDTVWKAVCPQGDHVKYRGNYVHVRGYLARFLFGPDKLEQKVYKLSGGEQARLLVARLMLKEANVLVLDEPTNDLDIVTLGLLEEALLEFDGAVILVTHDRYFMEQVASQVLVLDHGKTELFAGYAQWAEHRKSREAQALAPAKNRSEPSQVKAAPSTPVKKKKLSFNEQRELNTIEQKIGDAERRLATLSNAFSENSFLTNEERIKASKDLTDVQSEIDTLYARWQELES